MRFWLNLNVAKLQKKRLADLEEYHEILTRYWGFTEFRPLQAEIILSVGAGTDTLALMPTGGHGGHVYRRDPPDRINEGPG